VGSQSHINIPTVNSSANLAATQQQQQQQLQSQLHQQQEHPYQQYQQYQQQQQQHTGSTPGHSRSTSDGGLAGFAAISGSRSGSGNLLSLLKQQQPHQSPGSGVQIVAAPVAPSIPRAEMTLLPPVMQQRCVHSIFVLFAGTPGCCVQLHCLAVFELVLVHRHLGCLAQDGARVA
jgi:hypothetical protein